MKAKEGGRSTTVSGPNPVDVHVGGRVRLRRKFLGLSQQTLAGAIALTFQQVQKYERGTNRISASKLYDIARVLRAPAGYFFEGYNDNAGEEGAAARFTRHKIQTFLLTPEGVELAEAFPRISNPKHRQQVLALVMALADGATDGVEDA